MLDTVEQPRSLPHSEESERAVLAAILLDASVLPSISGRLRAEDFYLDRHRVLFSAVLGLQDGDGAVDLRTLQARLEQQGKLDAAGGLPYLAGLDLDLPDLGRVDAYVEIIKERSIRRRLIAASQEIIRDCLDGGLVAQEALGRAEKAVLGLGEEAIQKGFVQLSSVLHETLEDLEERPGSTLIGVPTGFIDFDRITHGLNRGNLIIIAGRPGMGKTSFALNLSQHVAIREGRPVGIFSLEMSAQELGLRVLCSEANVPFSRLRSGHLSQKQWSRIIQSTRDVGDAPLYIDDSPNPSLLEVASKARRLKADRGLELLVLDYLQLMQAGGRYENRNLEIAAISRSLKQLAKELDLPVIALSQLSRNPERRGSDHRPQLSDLRESGCLTGETLVTMADTGARVPMRELLDKDGFDVWAVDPSTLKLCRAEVSRAFSTGVKPVFRLTTRLGRTIRATPNHPFLTIKGWTRLDELKPGDRLALPRRVPAGSRGALMSDAELALLGHLIGDGCTLPRHAIQYTTREEDLAQRVGDLASQVFGTAVAPRVRRERKWFQVYLTSTRHHTHGTRSAVAEWLDGLEAWGLRSFEKFVPARVFEQPEDRLAVFLRHLWATDGCIRPGREGRYPAIYYATSSERLGENVQTLLLRMGIQAHRHVRPQGSRGRPQHHVQVSGRDQILRFAEVIGAVGRYKTQALAAVVEDLESVVANTNRDVIPREAWDLHVRPTLEAAKISHRNLHREIGTAYCGTTLFRQNLGRERAARVAAVIGGGIMARLAESDVYWDEIVAIEDDGIEEVFDLTVPGPSNFVADGFFVHNSIEQDADLVAFIFREELYKPDDPEVEGVAEVIIAKHRNGETGTIELAFLGETTTFKNLDRHHAPHPADPSDPSVH